ncbi:ABC transporter ATP-binding protein [Streptomyces alanosinicus]|uniref:ABC transporter ATP-binding protein n=2 Tax=Streptomyces alanosinicus TaxID=68171 RepID=A0A919D733_9ACTN|nr:ABC transporter ATP-binding protein [Streptomyces alanosinicus]
MVLSVEDVCAGYRGRSVLTDVNLDFGPGVHILLGPNGAGKTTLFRVLAAVLRPTSGRVLIAGLDPHHDPSAKRLVSVTAHRPALSPQLTVGGNLGYWARVLDLPVVLRKQRVAAAVSALHLHDLVACKAGTLSRGQAQRVALAKALLSDPPVLLLDEPTTGMDPAATADLRERLRGLAADGRTIIASTHNMSEAQALADDVTLLSSGHIAGRGTPAELREQMVGRGIRLRIRARLDPTDVLRGLGHESLHDRDGAVLVEVADDSGAETLIEELARQGVGLREVAHSGNALEEVFLHLDGQSRHQPTYQAWDQQ